jgi:hypothetical protein
MKHDSQDRKAGAFFASRANIVLIAFLAIGGFYLVMEHRAHLYGWWPLLFLLACPLMHLFMHHGHDGPPESGTSDDGVSNSRQRTPPHQH